MVDASTTAAKSPSDEFTTQCSGVWHFPQWGTPSAAAGTRFLVPQLAQTTTSLVESFAFMLTK
jgi:hypothetical protein